MLEGGGNPKITLMAALNRYSFSVGLLSTAVIAFELVLMQVFSITQWYHFAYMVISVAMLGFGAAGTFLAFFEKWLLQRYEQAFPLFLFLCGASMAGVIGLSNADAVRFDTYLLLNDWRQLGRLAATYLLFFIPFFLAALAMGLTFVRFAGQIGRLYFADLLGSGLGSLLAIGLLWCFPPWEIPAWLAFLPLLAGWISMKKRGVSLLNMAGVLAVLLAGTAVFFPPRPRLSEYKSLSKTMLLPGASVEHQKNSPQGLIQAVSSPALRYAPALSLNFQGEVPIRKAVFQNGDWIGAVVPAPQPGSPHILDYTAGALPFLLQKPGRVLVLQAGTGEQAAHALAHGAERITWVSTTPVLLKLLRNELAAETDSLVFQPGLRFYELEPRTFLYTDTNTYNLILLPPVSTFGGTAGLNALQEQYGMTLEAFRQMWRRLEADGILSISCWMDYPVRNPLKILASMVAVLEEEGIGDKQAHLIAVRSWGGLAFALKKSPFTEEEVQAARAFCDDMLFDPLLLPGLRPGERQQYNQIQDSLFFDYVDAMLSPERETFFEAYDFNVRPATDGRPYFSQFLRWQSLPALAEMWGSQSLPFLEAGYLIVLLTFAQMMLAALVLIILPLFRLGFRGGNKGWIVLYFGGLGLGYMFVEIVLIQQFILFFGQPVLATAAVISILLIASGLGSFCSGRWNILSRKLWIAPTLIALMLFAYLFLLPPAFELAIGLPLAAKLALLLLLVAPPGFAMGLPFPTGIRYLSENKHSSIPWAWGINGYFSVISTALATIIAVELGFWWVMALAAGVYGSTAVSSMAVGRAFAGQGLPG